ncbi:NmrA family NAD(P)-binding protein [Dactylosporangium sp. NPDC049525]|uniref:NmrA family NAD(P)-binding protein n=1 Tax=Dactylosporangium sp. NPDC049525 TaxID=3154730 RepID=UPI0034239CE7
MAKPFLVTGAAGKTGRYAVRQLLERDAPVRALVHRADARSDELAAAGAEVVVANMLDLAAVSAATRDVTAAYFAYPIIPGLLEATAIFAEAAAESGVGAIVNMSQISARRDAVSNAARQHWLAERVLDWSPVAVTHLRPTFFAEWLISFYQPDGTLQLPFGDGRHAPIAAEDQARVITAILRDPARHAGQVYRLFGAEELNHQQIAAEMSAALGREVRYVPVSLDTFSEQLRDKGFGEHIIQHLRAVAIDYRNGVFAGTNDVVRSIGGSEPMTVREFVTRNKQFYDDRSTIAYW